MTIRILLTVALLASVFSLPTANAADEHALKAVKEAPKGLSAEIEKLVNATGHQILGEDGAVVELWLLKSLPIKANFKSGASQLYPFTPGQLLGVMRVPKGAEYADFRGQEIASGTYTLRYGLQPEDGNHLGTSDTADFILALPAKMDTKPATIEDFYELSERSGKAAGSTHPAIFSLLDPKGAGKESKLDEDKSADDWVLTFTAKGNAKGKASDVKIRLVVIGESEA
ncbi:MAG: hypothetical protein ACKVHE_16745 [Planctomycetales bacterium]|jgi:hypothetical protein